MNRVYQGDSLQTQFPSISSERMMLTQLVPPQTTSELTADRRDNDRRQRLDRRVDNESTAGYVAVDRRQGERRAKVERRRQIDPTTCERDYSENEVDFMRAMDDYKRRSGRQFPTWSEVLEVIHSLGYRRMADPSEIKF